MLGSTREEPAVPTVQKKKCFLISPIGDEGSDIRVAADFVREDIVRAALGDEFEIKRADDYSKVGNITAQVIEAIYSADLIVVDLTGKNANVYYELGVAHTYKKHVVPMISQDDPERIPFDVGTERTIHYSLKTFAGRRTAQAALKAAVSETLANPVTNPVTNARGLAEATAQGDDKTQLLASISAQLADLGARMDRQEKRAEAVLPVVVEGLADIDKFALNRLRNYRSSAGKTMAFSEMERLQRLLEDHNKQVAEWNKNFKDPKPE